jgi:hypothetical protein
MINFLLKALVLGKAGEELVSFNKRGVENSIKNSNTHFLLLDTIGNIRR